ncbi:MAG: hypothetical protein FRX49_00368 [Trebouxia sp. A1-2]|nr:MAG: hypothetical protein FRX49_00368 [Trebouxia sp. A1-2]
MKLLDNGMIALQVSSAPHAQGAAQSINNVSTGMIIWPHISSCSCTDTKVSKRILAETSAVAFNFGDVQTPPTVVDGV